MVFAFNVASTSKETWSMVILIVRGLLCRPSLSGTQTVTYCSVHIHTNVAKQHMNCCTTPSLALDPVTKQLTFEFSSISAPPTYLAPTASRAVNKRNKESLSANTTDRSEGRDDVLDRDVVHQSHVSACLSTSCSGLVVSHRIDARTFAVCQFV